MQMVGTGEQTRMRVRSRDGVEIACWTSGDGPPLVLVHGTTADHARWQPILQYLEPHVTVHAIDRRGRGESGDAPDYDVVREFEDVAAVVDAVAEASGASVNVLGHSFGGFCAFGAAMLTSNVHRLVLYEGLPPLDPHAFALPPGTAARMEAQLADGNREAVLETFFREVVHMPDEEFRVYRTLPAWRARVAAAHTILRESRAEVLGALDLKDAASVAVPTLLLLGGDSPTPVKAGTSAMAAALPDARVVVLEGQQHIAIDLVPEEFARQVIAFLEEER